MSLPLEEVAARSDMSPSLRYDLQKIRYNVTRMFTQLNK